MAEDDLTALRSTADLWEQKARQITEQWQRIADDVDALCETVPLSMVVPYLGDDGLWAYADIECGPATPTAVIRRLVRVRADADALAAAFRRVSDRCAERTRAALTGLAGECDDESSEQT